MKKLNLYEVVHQMTNCHRLYFVQILREILNVLSDDLPVRVWQLFIFRVTG